MKLNALNIKLSILYALGLILFLSCQSHNETFENEEEQEHEEAVVHLSRKQFKALDIKVDTMAKRNMISYVETNGELTLPPQSEAAVTTVIGANITQVKVIEGNRVKKGQILAFISHPELFKLQSQYIRSISDLEYLEKEFERQEKLYSEKINSGREYQKVKSEYLSLQAETKGMENTLNLLHLNPKRIAQGKIYNEAAIRSPINGYIHSINVRRGQYVQAQDILFKIVNNDHIHAHFLVYENDVQKVKIGQKVSFQVASMDTKEYEAVIFSVGKVFVPEPKAVEIHAEIENTDGRLISGMYCRGRILTDESFKLALPADAVVREGDKKYIFTAEMHGLEWEFEAMEVITGIESDNWVEIKLLEEIDSNVKFVYNQAYYLLSEWKKDEGGHGHSHG